MDAKEKIRQEIRTARRAKDEWLLISLSRKGAGAISISSDTVWHGFDDHKELRGPRWRTLASALESSDIGYKWIVAGELSARVLFKQLINSNVPRGVIMHASAVERWAPECAKVKPALNSIRGFLNPTLPENKSRAATKPSRASKMMKRGGCALCGSTKDITLHHLIYRQFGGANEKENFLSVCRSCHNDIHAGKLDISDRVFQVFARRVEELIQEIRSQHVENNKVPSQKEES